LAEGVSGEEVERSDVADTLTVTYDLVLPFVRRSGRLLPLIQTAIQRGDGPLFTTHALIDTGAEISLFDGMLALGTGFDPSQDYVRAVPITGIGSAPPLRAFVHRVTLYVGLPLRFYTFETEIAFAEPSIQLAFSVLGRLGFLDHVRLGLDGLLSPPCLYLGFPA
jgi:hypothetical protein